MYGFGTPVRKSLYYPTSMTTVAGTLEEGFTVADAAVRGTLIHWEEVGSTPGYDIIFDFTGIPSIPSTVFVSAYYNGNHAPKIQIYNYTAADWDVFETLNDASGVHSYAFPVGSSHWSAGAMRVRFYHSQNGSATHDLWVDVIAVRC
jgi:hypothetical protein